MLISRGNNKSAKAQSATFSNGTPEVEGKEQVKVR